MRRRVPSTTVHGIHLKACWGCGASATVSLRPLGLNFHRFYCHACAKALRTNASSETRPHPRTTS